MLGVQAGFCKKIRELGRNFIHIHHLVELSTIKRSYQVDPVKDLRTVCPNCHAMIHKRRPAYSIEEIKTVLKQRIKTK